MDSIRLKFKNVKPLSTNDIHDPIIRRGKPSKIKIKKYKIYLNLISDLLIVHRKDLAKFQENYNPSTHVIRGKFIVYCPDFFTQKKVLSKKSIDADNCLKATIDAIFAEMPLLDDAFLVDPHPMKTLSPDSRYHIEILLFTESIEKYLEQF